MSTPTYNEFKSTTVYGNFINTSYPSKSLYPMARFDGNVYVSSGNVLLGTANVNVLNSLNSYSGTISTLQSAMTSTAGNVSTLSSNYSSLSTTVSGHTTQLTSISGSVSTLQSAMTSTAGNVSTLSSNYSSLSTTVSGHTTQLTSISGSVSTLQSAMTSTAANVSTLSSNYSSLSTTVSGHTTQIAALQTSGAGSTAGTFGNITVAGVCSIGYNTYSPALVACASAVTSQTTNFSQTTTPPSLPAVTAFTFVVSPYYKRTINVTSPIALNANISTTIAISVQLSGVVCSVYRNGTLFATPTLTYNNPANVQTTALNVGSGTFIFKNTVAGSGTASQYITNAAFSFIPLSTSPTTDTYTVQMQPTLLYNYVSNCSVTINATVSGHTTTGVTSVYYADQPGFTAASYTETYERTVTAGDVEGNNLYVGGKLMVYGASTLGQLSVSGASTLGQLSVSGASTLSYISSSQKNTAAGMIETYYSANDRYGIGQDGGGVTRLYTSGSYGPSSISMCLATGASSFSDLMTIGHNGVVYFGNASSSSNWGANGCLQIGCSGGTLQDGITIRASNDGNYIISFYNTAGGLRGLIGGGGTSGVNYQTSSDRRLKTNVRNMGPMLASINALRPVDFNWVADNSPGLGFIAQELHQVFPECRQLPSSWDGIDVDAPVDGNGNPIYFGLDYGRLTPYLVKAIQELSARVDALEKLVSHAAV